MYKVYNFDGFPNKQTILQKKDGHNDTQTFYRYKRQLHGKLTV